MSDEKPEADDSDPPYTTRELSEKEIGRLDIEDQILYAIYNGHHRFGEIVEKSAFSRDWTEDIIDDMVAEDTIERGTDDRGPFYQLVENPNPKLTADERADIHEEARRERAADSIVGDAEDVAATMDADTDTTDDSSTDATDSTDDAYASATDAMASDDDTVDAERASEDDVAAARETHGGLLPVDRRYDWTEQRLAADGVADYISANGEKSDIVAELEDRRVTGKLPHFSISGPTGCHAPGQEVLMYDGTTKAVENVEVGDQLMGPGSEPREVQSLTSGTDEMYRINPTKGDSFTVNSDHQLSLIRTNDGTSKAGDIVDPTIEEWQEWSDTHKHIHKLFRRRADFETNRLNVFDPYVLGVLIGDGSLTNGTQFHAESPSVIDAVRGRLPGAMSLTVVDHPSSGAVKKCYISTAGRGPTGTENYWWSQLQSWGLNVKSGEKFIPQRAKTAPRTDRRRILAGLMDADGWVEDGRAEYYTKSDALAEDVAFVARSLGLAAYVRENETPDNGVHNRVAILGDLPRLPMQHESKQPKERRQKKSVRRTGFDVEAVGEGQYYGFTVDGDHRYLLDDFTVTHNCGKTTLAESIAVDMNAPVFMIHCHEGLRPSNLLGMPTYVGDETWWIDGPIPKALLSSQEQPTVVILDEVNRTSSRTLGVLMSMLDHQCKATLNARGGETIEGDPMNLIVFSTMNEGDGYVVNAIDDAQKRRLGNKYYTDYIGMNDVGAEADLIADRTPVDRDVAMSMVKCANDIRRKAKEDSAISMGVPTSTMLDWARTAWTYRDQDTDAGPLVKAGHRSMVNPYYKGDSREEDTVVTTLESHLKDMPVVDDEVGSESKTGSEDSSADDDSIAMSDETFLMCSSCGWYEKVEDAPEMAVTTMECPSCDQELIPKESS